MKFVDVVEVAQQALAQTMGTEYMEQLGDLSAIPMSKLVDIGQEVTADATVDKFVKALLTQIGKIVIDAKRYTADIPSIFIDSFDWGGYVERVYFSPQDVIEDDMWNLVDGKDYSEKEHTFYQPNVQAKLFVEAKAITTPISISQDTLKMAFTGWEKMNEFLSGVRQNVSNTIELALQSYAHMLVSVACAYAVNKTGNAIHLISEYNDTVSEVDAVTFETALNDGAFLAFMCERIKNVRDNMKSYTTAYNNGAIPTFTMDEDNKLVMLSQVANAIKFKVKANTYNKDDIAIGDYDKLTAWQGFKASDKPSFDLATASAIRISADPSNKLGMGTDAVSCDGVVALAFDHRALGLCPYKRKVTSSYTACADFWNEFHHVLVNYIMDANFNMVAFVLD